ncbi:hypothetical protein EUBVEN_00999 [Eubacterium ventriosum ATCC 27560]|uniref:Uncharacterized protein n=1 Tax=Eubacterium ventriosum ATCC 27560 TaxID=411463 RepID=A5Z5L8_9FIRM|nr:hypothetical protein EUBVEN_00999 [Eubacterium ventriosum ATCC 27560]
MPLPIIPMNTACSFPCLAPNESHRKPVLFIFTVVYYIIHLK